MEQLIFLAVIIVFSILDSVARSRKKRQRAPSGEPRTSRAPEEWSRADELPSYDEDPSYDETYELETTKPEPTPLPRYTQPYGSEGKAGSGRASPGSSEGMIPADIWEEIAGLARDRTPARAPEPPRPAPVPEVESSEDEPVRVRAHRVRTPPSQRLHRTHLGYGTDPSTRPRSAQDGLDPLRATIGKDARSVRRQLTSRSRSALRRAIILQEVLGPPAATRSERTPG